MNSKKCESENRKMPSKKKKYNARFPPARIKKIMQTDEEVGKVAAAVPVIISRALELFVDGLLKKTSKIITARNAKTLTLQHLKLCIEGEPQFDFLKDLVANVPDMPQNEFEGCNQPATATTKPSTRGRPRGRPRLGSSSAKRNSVHSDTDEETQNVAVDLSDRTDTSPIHRQSVIQSIGQVQRTPSVYDDDGGNSREQVAATLASMATMGSPTGHYQPQMQHPQVTIQLPEYMKQNHPPSSTSLSSLPQNDEDDDYDC